MKYSIDKEEKHSIFKLKEDKLNSIIAPHLKSEMVILNAEGIKNIILDMSHVKFADSSGLSAILVANRLCQGARGSFVITNVNDNVAKLIKISQLDSILQIVPTNEEAIDFIIME